MLGLAHLALGTKLRDMEANLHLRKREKKN